MKIEGVALRKKGFVDMLDQKNHGDIVIKVTMDGQVSIEKTIISGGQKRNIEPLNMAALRDEARSAVVQQLLRSRVTPSWRRGDPIPAGPYDCPPALTAKARFAE